MKLQIKTLHQKSLLIDIDDTKTVYDLKRELTMYPDVGVQPELQKLIYAGKILSNEEPLSGYNIDVKKFLVVMILKQPLEDALASSTSATAQATEAAASTEKAELQTEATALPKAAEAEFKTPPPPPPARRDSKDELVQNIVGMGYPESEVRRALEASFYSPERAIEYLIEGIPETASTGEHAGINYSDYADESDVPVVSPIEVFRSDPLFRNLRRAIQQHPELIDDAIQRVGEANPSILHLINENQQEFLSMLVDASDAEDDEDDDESS